MNGFKPSSRPKRTSARTARLAGLLTVLLLFITACGQGTRTSEAVGTDQPAKVVVTLSDDPGAVGFGTGAIIIVPEADEDPFWDLLGKDREIEDNLRFVQGGAVTAETAPDSAQISTITNDGTILFEPDDGPYLACWLNPYRTEEAPLGAEGVWRPLGCSRVIVDGPAQWGIISPHDAGTQIYEVSNG